MAILGILVFAFVLLAAAPAGATIPPRERRRVFTLIPENRLPPKPVEPEPEPAPELLEGGVPLEDGWRTVGWYSYRDRTIWIRVDISEAFGSGPGAHVILPGISDRWAVAEWTYRWTVVVGEQTAIASEIVEDDFGVSGPSSQVNPEWAYGQVMAEVYQHIARLGSDWVDDNIPVTQTILPMPHITPMFPLPIKPKPTRGWAG